MKISKFNSFAKIFLSLLIFGHLAWTFVSSSTGKASISSFQESHEAWVVNKNCVGGEPCAVGRSVVSSITHLEDAFAAFEVEKVIGLGRVKSNPVLWPFFCTLAAKSSAEFIHQINLDPSDEVTRCPDNNRFMDKNIKRGINFGREEVGFLFIPHKNSDKMSLIISRRQKSYSTFLTVWMQFKKDSLISRFHECYIQVYAKDHTILNDFIYSFEKCIENKRGEKFASIRPYFVPGTKNGRKESQEILFEIVRQIKKSDEVLLLTTGLGFRSLAEPFSSREEGKTTAFISEGGYPLELEPWKNSSSLKENDFIYANFFIFKSKGEERVIWSMADFNESNFGNNFTIFYEIKNPSLLQQFLNIHQSIGEQL